MRSRPTLHRLKFAALLLVHCAGPELPRPPRPDSYGRPLPVAAPLTQPASVAAATPAATDSGTRLEVDAPASTALDAGHTPVADSLAEPHCAGVPPLGPDGSVPPAPAHVPLGEELAIPGDRAAYVLPGLPGDRRVIVYLHGMCGDVTAPDYFRVALQQHGTLLALRGDTPCANERFKWRDAPSRIQQRVRTALKRLNALNGTDLSLEGVILFGYSQGADRAEKLAQHFPQVFRRVVLGGPPMRASPLKLRAAERVAIFGGELETTDTMQSGAEALQAAGIACRYFTLECAYHGYYGSRAEEQLAEVLGWVAAP
jgi:predicted esterase